ncbi:MAG: Uma2 family endonuclease [Myxococcota bacterium]|nr:Uma2 family endonuclease [Myxococcota bacterium]
MRIEDFHVPTPPPGAAELPSSDGEPMETQRHVEQMHLLIGSLHDAWRARDDFFCGGDMFVYYSEPQAREAQRRGTTRFRGPDVFVVLDTDRRERPSWVAWEEGGKLPDVIIELTSPTTESIDRHDKMELYARIWRTGAYFLYDPLTHRFEGYELDASERAYRPMEPLPSGDLPVVSLGLALGVRELPCNHLPPPSLRWIDAAGRPLPTGSERALRAEEERDRAREERDRAEARARELEAELGRAKKRRPR